jgi:hypothetical protein
MILHPLFCDIDDFCRDYVPEWKKTQLAVAYSYQPKKPSLNLRQRDLLPLLS